MRRVHRGSVSTHIGPALRLKASLRQISVRMSRAIVTGRSAARNAVASASMRAVTSPFGLAQHRAAAGAGQQPHHARRRDRAGRPEDTADRTLRPDGTPHRIAGVETRQAATFLPSAMRVEIPPRDAVHRKGHGGMQTEERRDRGSNGGQRRCLDGHDNRAWGSEISRVVAGADPHVDGAVGRFHGQAVG